MKLFSHHAFSLLALAGLLISAVPAYAQDAPADQKKIKLVEFTEVKPAAQKTPDFTLKGGTTDKRWKPKEWIEIESTLKVSPPKGDSKSEVIPELTFNYYVYLNGPVAENRRVLTGTVVHTNVPLKETVHAVVYISPSTILKVTGKPEGSLNQVSMLAVQVTMGGDLVGQFVKGDENWWKNPKAPTAEALLLNKLETPFATLWGDYHLDVKSAK